MTSEDKEVRFETILPSNYQSAHDLCFLMHDIMLQALQSGESSDIFMTTLDISSEDAEVLKSASNVFEWLDSQGRTEDKIKILRATVLRAVLSDALHCIYEALKCSQKGKLNITYMLIRKPIQESLYLIEAMRLDDNAFSSSLTENPLALRPKNAGGVDNHIKRVSNVISLLGDDPRLNGEYIARLRYDKNVEDNFDGICNLAMHLFTEHKAIKTENLNVNFIFSDWESKLTQWSYLYSRLPYLLYYFYMLVESTLSKVAKTPNDYLFDMQRRIIASVCLWWEDVGEAYRSEELFKFYKLSKIWLDKHCIDNGFATPRKKDLVNMAYDGSFPGETDDSVKARLEHFKSMSHEGVSKKR